MSKRVVIGYARSKAEGLIYEQLLRDRGVPAFSEMGIAAGEFTESSPSRIFAERDLLRPEHLDEIRDVLGSNAADVNLGGLEEELQKHVVAVFEEYSEAKMYMDLLKKRRVQLDVVENELQYELVSYEPLTDEQKKIAAEYLGDKLAV